VKLSVVVPAHNEAERVKPMLDAYTSFYEARYGDDMELIVVVNGSTDETEGIVKAYAERHPQVRPLVESRPVGKGGAVILGFAAARGDLVGFVDADGSTSPAAFQDLVDHIGDAGAIIATRWHRDAEVSPRQPLSRRVASRMFNLLVRLLFGLRLSDTQCGAKLLARPALRAILPRIGLTRWAFDVDLLFQLRRAGFVVVERPTVWHDVAGSKLNVAGASFEMLLAICRLRLMYSPFSWVVELYNRSLGRHFHKV
jgi:glycosyltransferase involved in cell wall biosynthesis